MTAPLGDTVAVPSLQSSSTESHPTAPSGEVRAIAIRQVALVRAGEVRLAVSRPSGPGA